MIKVYIVEDRGHLLDDIVYSLKVQGHDCRGVHNVQQLEALIEQELPDIVILDWTLSGDDGLSIARKLRQNKITKQIGIIFLTARSSLHERLIALELVDSYQVKPVDYRELGAIIASIYRRLGVSEAQHIPEISWRLHENSHELHAPSGPVLKLSFREYQLIAKLAENKLPTVSSQTIVELWGEEWAGYKKNRLELILSRLRKKIMAIDPLISNPIQAVRNLGYSLQIPIKVIKHSKFANLINHYSYPTSLPEVALTLGRDKYLSLGNQVCELSKQAVMITDKDKNIIRVNAAFCEATGYQVESILGCNPRVLSSGKHDPNFYQAMWQQIDKHDTWSGEIYNRRKNGEVYLQSICINALRNLKGDVENYLALFSDITEEREHIEYLKELSGRDALTGLPNRLFLERKFYELLALSKRNNAKFGVLFIGLNKFKPINDQYGHAYGDILLQMIAARIDFTVREVDCVIRLGGDEFIVLMISVEHQNSGQILADRLKAIIAKPLGIDDVVLQVTASIGIAVYPDDGEGGLDGLHQVANERMYQDKGQYAADN